MILGKFDDVHGRRSDFSITVGRCLGAAVLGTQRTNFGYKTWEEIYIF